MIQNLLFLDREELTDLYIEISLFLRDHKTDINIIHVAFSEKEELKLNRAGITNFISYSSLYNSIDERYSKELIDEIDNDIIHYSNGRFSLNSAMQSDRTLTSYTYDEAISIMVKHYSCWKKILSNLSETIIVHEACSLFFNYIAAILVKKNKGYYLWHVQAHGIDSNNYYLNIIGDQFECPEITSFFRSQQSINPEIVTSFVENETNNKGVFFSNISSSRSIIKIVIKAFVYKLRQLFTKCPYTKSDSIDYWIWNTNTNLEKCHNLIGYKKLGIKFNEIHPDDNFFYYSFHLEPEAVVLYIGDGLYKNQVKLIENIASSIPPGYFLYVKDHPHEYAYRNPIDYSRLQSIPNVKLIKQSIPGKVLIEKSKGVFTINGTAGFEGILFNKHVYTFANTFYSLAPNVHYIANVRDIRQIVYNTFTSSIDQNLRNHFLSSYIQALHIGFVSYFRKRADRLTNKAQNAELIANNLINICKTM